MLEVLFEREDEGRVRVPLEIADHNLDHFLKVVDECVRYYLHEFVCEAADVLRQPFKVSELSQYLLDHWPQFDEDGLDRRGRGVLFLHLD